MAHTIKARLASPPQARTDGAGLDHDIYIAWTDPDDNELDFLHKVFPIPTDRFAALLENITNTERVELYKSLVVEFFFTPAAPMLPPVQPTNMDFSVLDDYIDAQEAHEAALAAVNVQTITYAGQATAWLEGLVGFENWTVGVKFELQIGD